MQSTLKQAEAEIAQVTAQAKITQEQDQTAVMKARYDLDRAKLDLRKEDLISKIEFEQAKLAVGVAESKLKEAQERSNSDKASARAEVVGKERKRDKALFDMKRWQAALDALKLRAPADGIVNVLPNWRASSPFGGEVEFREGDRAWSGADRGRLQVGQAATVRIEAVPGKDFVAKVDLISVLARVDFSSGWPPARNFDLGLVLQDRDTRIRPGMTATARIAAERIPNVLLAPTEAVFQHDGHPVVYRLRGSRFDEQRIDVTRRGREQVAIGGGVTPGDKIATRRPEPDQIRRPS